MDYKTFIKNNIKFLVVILITITVGVVGITYAINASTTSPIDVNTSKLEVNISFKNAEEDIIVSNGKMMPISDYLVEEHNINIEDERVLKSTFTVSNVNTNPENTIYDIALHKVEMDCELRSEYVKWRLYKDGSLLSEGNFSKSFDIMENDRLVLTETQEDLNNNETTYVFIMWISESCPSDISILECKDKQDQSSLLNKKFKASIDIELSTKSKKDLVRVIGVDTPCENK